MIGVVVTVAMAVVTGVVAMASVVAIATAPAEAVSGKACRCGAEDGYAWIDDWTRVTVGIISCGASHAHRSKEKGENGSLDGGFHTILDRSRPRFVSLNGW
jgi:hypothetical protein